MAFLVNKRKRKYVEVRTLLSFCELERPRIDIELYGTDTHIPPIDKVRIMDEHSFEQFTLEWLYGCKKTKYSSIKQFGEPEIKVEILLRIMAMVQWIIINVSIIKLRLCHQIIT